MPSKFINYIWWVDGTDAYPGKTSPEEVGRQQLDKVLNHAGAARLALQPLPGQDHPPDHPVRSRADHVCKSIHGFLSQCGCVA